MDDMTAEDMLVTRRSKRSTAGNRMHAVLEEMDLEVNVAIESVEEDADFVNDKVEEDEFGSDFESTDEEAAQADVELAGERAVQDEERRIRKDARSRLEKATAAAHAKHRVTFNPQAQPLAGAQKPKEPKRRVSMGYAIDAETGQPMEVEPGVRRKERHSQRKHTILNTSATVTRMKQSEEKKAATSKKVKMTVKTLSQAELIARALDNEEGNIIEHKNYLMIEEEKRRQARPARTAATGSLLRWVSKVEEVKVTIPPPPRILYTPPAQYPFAYGSYNVAGLPFSFTGAVPSLPSTSFMHLPTAPSAPSSNIPPSGGISSSSSEKEGQSITVTPTPTPAVVPSASQTPAPENVQVDKSSTTATITSNIASTITTTTTPPSQQFLHNPYLAHLQAGSSFALWPYSPPPQQPIERIEKVTKNYVIQEVGQYAGCPKPSWNETMTAMFGDHVNWENVKVYTGKSRPLSRPKQMCPITGKQAKYLDPKSGVPFADLDAYRVLDGLLKHEYIWSPALKRYVGRAQEGVDPDGETEAMVT